MKAAPRVITTDQQAEAAWSHGGDHAPADLLSRCALISRHVTAPKERAEALLDAIVSSLGCLAGSATIGDGSLELDVRQMSETEGIDAWVPVLDEAAMDSRSHAALIARLFGPDSSAPKFALVSSPIEAPGRDPIGGIAVLCRCSSAAQAERVQLYLRAACMQASSMFVRQATARKGVEMSDIARIYNRAGQFRTLDEFAFTIANAVRQRFDCDQASIGIVRDGRISVRCVSGLDQVKRRSPGVHRLEQAMGECLDAGRPVVAQRSDTWQETDFADEGMLHQRWSAAAANASVLSLPIRAGDDVVAVVSLRRDGDHPFDAADVDAADRLLSPLAGAIPLVRRSTRSVASHAMHSTRGAMHWAVAKGSLRRKAIVLASLGAIAWGAMGESTSRISMPATIVAAREHVVSAPIDGVVDEVLVRSGDTVRQGEPLVQLRAEPIELELREVEAEIERQTLRVREGIASGEPGPASVARQELRALSKRRDRLATRLESSIVRAPRDGIVVAPELGTLDGRVLRLGDPMLMLAESGSLAIELEAPERRITDLEVGARVRFASHARPESPGFTTLGPIETSSVSRDGRTVFLAEAAAPDDQPWLRPGMKGVAIVEAGERPNWWFLVHRVTDAARLRFWME